MEKLKVSLRGCYTEGTGVWGKELTFFAKLVEVKEESDEYSTWWTQEKEFEIKFIAEQDSIVHGLYLSVPESLKKTRKADIPFSRGNNLLFFPFSLEEGSSVTIVVPKKLLHAGCGEVDEGV